MLLLDALRAEHALIEEVLGSLRTYVARRSRSEAPPGDGSRFVLFFRAYAGRFHHAREEDVLMPALVESAGLAADHGPIAALLAQHREMAGVLDELSALLTNPAADGAALESRAIAYSHALWAHIDAENSVLFPESETRLRRAGVRELPDREMTAEEQHALEEGRALVALYPPAADPSALRGEGCVLCPSHGVSCDGIEREWWSDEEWEDFFERNG